MLHETTYHIFSVIRRSIFSEKIGLFALNLFQTGGASYSQVLSPNKKKIGQIFQPKRYK